MTSLTLTKDPAAVPVNAETSAAWAVNMADGPERRRLMAGHRSRRIPTMKAGFRATDYSAADAWLCAEYAAAQAAEEQ